jgi:drug/metabolite transporter (DMT)-like permease
MASEDEMSEAGRQDMNAGAAEQRGPGVWIGALILIGVGIVFLLQNLGYNIPSNWWALFLLIPAVFAFAGGWQSYVRNGRRLGPGMVGPAITGLVLIALTLLFLFDLDADWNLLWPAALIFIGVGVLAGLYRRR